VEEGAEVVDFTSMVEVVSDHEADEDAGGQAVAVQFGIVGELAIEIAPPGLKPVVHLRGRGSLCQEVQP
jgi:hypothetical protein